MNLFPKVQRPYFIYAPSYTHISSGVRTLHLLCHALNEVGQKAYIVPDYPQSGDYCTNPSLNTPLLEGQHTNFYKQFLNGIVIYPDIVRGNPIGANNVVRYLMAPAGAYGGDAIFSDTDNIWGGLPSVAKKILRIPVSDTSIFFDGFPITGVPGYHTYSKRNGSCFYSHKYEMHGNQLLEMPPDCERICGTLEQCADILRSKEVCYLYELSSIITEAALCGCPVVLRRTDYFNTIDQTCMMGNVRWDDGEIVKECDDFGKEYAGIMFSFWLNLGEFIRDTQEKANG